MAPPSFRGSASLHFLTAVSGSGLQVVSITVPVKGQPLVNTQSLCCTQQQGSLRNVGFFLPWFKNGESLVHKSPVVCGTLTSKQFITCIPEVLEWLPQSPLALNWPEF